MMQCKDIDELMVEFLYQELEGEQLEAFQKHVDGCARCGAEMKSLMRTRQALRALPEAEPSAAVSARLLHEAAKRAPKEEGGGVLAWFGKLFGPLAAHPAWAAAASLLLVATVAGFLSVRAKMDGQLRHETATATTSAPAAVETTPMPAAPATPPPPRDVTVLGGDGTRGAVQGAALDEARKAADEKAAATAKEVREVGDKAPEPYYRKVAAPAAAGPTGKKGTAPADAPAVDDAIDRFGRTASSEEDLKLAQPAKPLAKPAPSRAKQGLSGDTDLGGVAASPPPAPAPEPAPSGLAQRYEPKAEAGSRRDDAADTRAAGKTKAPLASTPSQSGAGAPAAAAAAPAAPPPPPPSSSTASRGEAKDVAANEEREALRPSAPPAEVQAQAKGDTRPAPKVPPEQELLQLAQKQATTGLCTEALGTRDRIARMNPEFFRRRVAGDSTLRRCEEQNKKNRAPARAVRPASAPDEATTEKVK